MKYIAAIMLVLLSCIHPVLGSVDTIPETERPKIGLVLSGGGAHGLAHIGVLRMLEELEIPVDYITGTSMGAIIGALAAMGHTADEIEAIALSLNWDHILSNTVEQDEVAPAEKRFHDNFPVKLNISKQGLKLPIGAVNSHNLDIILARLYSPAYAITDFDDLPTPFKCYATDLASCEAVEMDSGRLNDAIRSSMSIPSFFSPVRDEDKLYVDGGVANNFPVEQVRSMGADIVIGSYVGARMLSADELISMDDILKQIGFFQSLQDFKEQQNTLDILIQPDVKMVSSFSFDLDEFFIEKGYEASVDTKEALSKLRDSFDLKPKAKESLNFFTAISIDEIVVKGVSPKTSKYLISRLNIPTGRHVALSTIEQKIYNVYGTKNFESLRYNLERTEVGKNRLVIHATQEKKASLGLSLNRFRSTGLAIILGAKLRNYGFNLLDINIHTRLSDFPGIYGRLTKRGSYAFSGLVYGVDTKAEVMRFPIYVKGVRQQENNLTEVEVRPFVMYEFNNRLSSTFRYNYTYQRFGNRIESPNEIDKASYRSLGTQLNVDYNTLNKAIFPTDGMRGQLSAMYLHHIRYAFPEHDTLQIPDFTSYVFEASFRQIISLNDRVSLDYQFGANIDTESGYKPATVGGNFQNIRNRVRHIGIRSSGLQSFNLAYANVSMRYRFGKSFYLIPTLSYINTKGSGSGILGYGVEATYVTPIGPISFSLGSRTDKFKVVPSLTVGKRYIF